VARGDDGERQHGDGGGGDDDGDGDDGGGDAKRLNVRARNETRR
jgi:hypothetical protein